jgi:hypothetical protein
MNFVRKCYLCGSTENLTRDHIPPENIFPKPKPTNLITVPCCRKCNEGFSKDDEAFRLWVASSVGRSPAGDWIWEKKVVGSTLRRSPKLLENIQPFFGKDWMETPHGKIEMDTLAFPPERMNRYLVRLTKGLLCAFYPAYDYSKDVFAPRHIQQTQKNLAGVRDLICHLKYIERGERVFRAWHGISVDSGKSGAWVYTFYDGACFIVFHYYKELQLECRTIDRERE